MYACGKLFSLLQVGDNRSLLQSLKESAYYKRFQEKISIWETRLAALECDLLHLQQIQRKWLHLEPLFGRGALPKERFKTVDDEFRLAHGVCAHDIYEHSVCVMFRHIMLCIRT
jgi:Dynein heavy chain, N-terminal region 2